MPTPPNEGPGFFEEARRNYERAQRQKAQNNAGCAAALILCTFMVCVTAALIVWFIYG